MNKIYYLDDNNNFTDREKSTHSMIQEFDNNGKLTREIFIINHDKLNYDSDGKYIPSQETQNILNDILNKAGYDKFSK